MEIEKDYLAQIFDGDQIFVFQEQIDRIEYNVENDSLTSKEVKERPVELKLKDQASPIIEKEIVILVNNRISSSEKETLNKLLKAINIDEGQYEIIHEHPEKLKSIQHLKLFLSFHNQFIQSKNYEILKINKGYAIYAHDLAELNKDSSKKLMLWNLLKTIV